MSINYSYKGFRPYGAAQHFILDQYVDDNFQGNIVEEILLNKDAVFSINNENAILKIGHLEIDFVKED